MTDTIFLADMFPEYKVNRKDLWAAMDVEGVLYAKLEYSGGNDSGSTDAIQCYTKKTKHKLHKLDGSSGYEHQVSGGYLRNEDAYEPDPGSILFDLLDRIPSEKYGSYAGEYTCHGVIIIDRQEQTVTLSGYESIEHSVDEKF